VKFQIGLSIDNYMSIEKPQYRYIPGCWVGGVWYTSTQEWENKELILDSDQLVQLSHNPEISAVCSEKYLAVMFVDDFIDRMKRGEIE